MKYLILFLITTQAFAGRRADKPKFQPGERVKVVSCKDGAYDYRVSTDRINKPDVMSAYKYCLRSAGKIAVVQYVEMRACGPIGIDSCDDYRYEIRFDNKGNEYVGERLLRKFK